MDKYLRFFENGGYNFSIFHLNIASLQYHFEDLKALLSSLEHEFDIISITETKLQKNTPPIIDIKIPNYDINTHNQTQIKEVLLYTYQTTTSLDLT